MFVCSYHVVVLPQYTLARVKQLAMGPKKVPYIVTHDGRTIRYPDPAVAVNDSVKVDIEVSHPGVEVRKRCIRGPRMSLKCKRRVRPILILREEKRPILILRLASRRWLLLESKFV